ncbi:type III restriction-modification system endonuclease [Burkholderia mayonis]|uniref:Restriction endonuclease subunit R n=1 Tax=Burkholderia mayonis TaxID=1385591 RepID=A0A1B4FX95_9BURK|nr:DEAD/DEAH box helicase family protein [Burkholderia mayonis]AOJ08307.1 restriction endonuclease subunit R [Burkholderia mayonis]KVE54670.1 restriction endonuclease subunit R [Burkholderia mayonis]
MQLHFESDLDYQLEAIEAVCDLFRGQEACRAEFSVTAQAARQRATPQMSLGMAESGLGVGNRLTLDAHTFAENLARVQVRNGLPPCGAPSSNDFTVEMETGTGKTYVYLRTIFELHRRFDFTKFVIVVPSVAIKEGVYKTLQITEQHFKRLYAGVPFDYFVYDSAKLGEVRSFASKSTVQIMIVTVAAINKKDVNNLYKDSEKTGGEKPIDLIRATHPIVIVDEPQSVDGGLEGRGKEALDAMRPLCTLRYSATHADKYQMLYRLDAIDAYERKLVKQIEIASATVEDAHNKPFMRVMSIGSRRGAITARVELDVATPAGDVERQTLAVADGDDLERVTKRAVYANFRIGAIHAARGAEYLELRYPGGDAFLSIGDAYGDVDVSAIQREMIRRTIREHLDKELRLKPLGVKVLSLFFVDAVDKYRKYDRHGHPFKGDYALLFEEEYRRAAKLPAYRALFDGVDPAGAAEAVHDGYFSIDKKGGWTDTSDKSAGSRENAERAYSLIMKDKERLLSFDTPLKFIFSHSALKEGWDNPNVFQICTLRDIHSERERRQTIGRGLRLAVDQRGERVRGFDVNTLTVIAGERYEQFAENLQKEIEADTGIRFGVVETHQFAALPVPAADGSVQSLGVERSTALWTYLRDAGYLDARGRVQDTLRAALKLRALPLPAEFDAQRALIVDMLRKLAGRLDVRNADERRHIALRRDAQGKAVYLGDAFRVLWDRIKYRTTYRVNFDNARLIERCVAALKAAPEVAHARLQWRKADIAIDAAGVEATETTDAGMIAIDEGEIDLPDLLTELQDRTQLTRRTIATVLIESGRLDEFPRNPQRFIALVAATLERCKRDALVDGIEYKLLGEQHVHALSLFEDEPLTGYLSSMRRDATKSIHEDVPCDTTAELAFADALEQDDAVRLYAKLPGWFRIPTPLGNYSPDWAVMIAENDGPRLYFVVETKSGLADGDLRAYERRKIQCGAAHFRALEAAVDDPARYVRARTIDDLPTTAANAHDAA